MPSITHQLVDIISDKDVGGYYTLPSEWPGFTLGIPWRDEYYLPKGKKARIFIARIEDFDDMSDTPSRPTEYRVMLCPTTASWHSNGKWTKYLANSALSKVAKLLVGGLWGAALGGAARVIIPTDAAKTYLWDDLCDESGNKILVRGVTSGF